MPPLGRSFLACAVGLLAAAAPARAYDSEEHKLIADWGASMVRLPPSIALPFPTRFHDTTLAARQKVYMDAKYLACGFRSNKQSDYSEDVHEVQDHSYWYGYAQLAGNKKLWIPPDSVLRETTLVVGTRLNTGQAVGFTIGELVSIYGDYRRTVYCATGDCYLTDANYARLHFDEGWDCFGPLNCGWRPPDVSMYEYLRDVGSGLWPPYGTCGNASGNTAADDQYYDAGWWGDEMIRIAGTNDWHFSSAAIAWYVGMHRLALIYVDRARTDPRFWNHALHYEANGLHSLTDLFAFGHIVANRDRTSHAAMVSSGVTGKKAYLWMEHAIDVGGGTRKGNGRITLDTGTPLPEIRDVANDRNDFMASYVPALWALYAGQEKDFHDAYNHSGAWVRNLKGESFHIFGDGDLRRAPGTARFVAEAVRASLQSLFDAYGRLEGGETIAQIGAAGDAYFEAMKNVPVFVDNSDYYTFQQDDCRPAGPSQRTGHNYDGQWTRFARFADWLTGTGLVPPNDTTCVMRYEDGEREIEPAIQSPRPCTTFPTVTSPPPPPPPPPPPAISMRQSWPNPLNVSATIEYTLSAEAHVRLEVFDFRGSSVAVLDEGVRPAATHRIVWNGTGADGKSLRPGIYVYQLSIAGRVPIAKKLVLFR